MNRIIVRGVAASALLAAIAFAGPLDPPAGPITPTNKTLQDVQPRVAVNTANTPGTATCLYRISSPGSYYLTGSFFGVSAKNGIEIISSGVTLDLNGFDLTGVTGSLDGVTVPFGGLSNIDVRNGSIHNWGGMGVNFGVNPVAGGRIDHIKASSNIVGIRCGLGYTIAACSSTNNLTNTGYGFYLGADSTITGCSAIGNGSAGNLTNTGCMIADCTSQNNLAGASVGNYSVATNTTCAGNSTNGFNLGNGVTLTACTAGTNTFIGVSGSFGNTITGCTVSGNGAAGITVSSGCTIVDCTSRGNSTDGITCIANCLIRGNLCDTNGNGAGSGANIHATGAGNRIEANSCTTADRGIEVGVAGNIIIRNTCSGNTINWVLVANNVFGPILDRTAPASAAVNGNAAASSLGSTDPNANFTY